MLLTDRPHILHAMHAQRCVHMHAALGKTQVHHAAHRCVHLPCWVWYIWVWHTAGFVYLRGVPAPVGAACISLLALVEQQ